jgi:aldose 1-epimerase
MLAALVAAMAPQPTAETTTDAASGLAVVVLRAGDVVARIAPAQGGQLFSLAFRGEELLVQPDALDKLAQGRGGTPVLFPMPNRVRDARFTFEGKTFAFEPNMGPNFIHGLVRRSAFVAAPPRATATTAEVALSLDWDDRQPEFARFPLPHRLVVSYVVRAGGVRIAYAVENRGRSRLPFGFGLHPWFRAPDRAQTFLRVPAPYHMEATDKLPSGKLDPVAGTPFDLGQLRAIEGLDLDDVYFGVTPARAPVIELRDRNVRVTLRPSPAFTHVVVFTPPGQPFFCVENQTSSTDAHNLWANGARRASHLQIVEPGATARGFVDWKVEPLP